MLKRSLFILFLAISSISTLIAQTAIVGTVVDGEFDEPLAFANVVIRTAGSSDTLAGVITDFEGNYSVVVESEGIYEVEFSYLGYQTIIISEVNVQGDEIRVDIVLQPAANALEEVVVTTSAKRNTESSVLAIQKGAAVLLDGLSAQNIRKSGDGNVAAAIKRVPGVSIQGGKFVFVRGLGDRYSKTLLSGIEVPGLDPDRNTLQLDIFPTNLLDNIQVTKSASAENPADFTGGLVDILLRDFSILPEYTVSLSTSYNSLTNFKTAPALPDYALNGLFFDSGVNDVPFSSSTEFKRPPVTGIDALTLVNNVNALTKQMAVSRESNLMDFSIGFTASNQFNLNESSSLGYIASINYKFDSDYYERAINRTGVIRNGGPSQYLEQIGELGSIQAITSGLFGLAWKTPNFKHKALVMAIRSGESNAFDGSIRDYIDNPYTGVTNTMTHTQRDIISIPVSGSYRLGSKWNIDWRIAPSIAEVRDIDFRKAVFNDIGNNIFLIDTGSSIPPLRLWRDLNEQSLSGKLDVQYNYGSRQNKLKFGFSYLTKERTFRTEFYALTYQGNSAVLGGNFDNILNPDFIYNSSTNQGTFITGGLEANNQYESRNETVAAYLSNEFKFSETFKAVLGVRLESFEILYTGQDIEKNIYNDASFIDVTDLYPSLNIIYSLAENSNLRASYSSTTARPSFKESSAANIYDPIVERSFLGNLELKPSYIDNFDLRYEKYGEDNQFLALSLFYKLFEDPIEVNYYSVNTPNDYIARNSNDAAVFGLEFELRKNIVNNDRSRFSINLNTSIINSDLEMTDQEYNFRLALAKQIGIDSLDRNRVMQGQSPYLVNAGLNYNLFDKELEAGLFYNVQGRALQVISAGEFPEVYTEPFHSLNLNVSKRIGSEKKTTFSIKAENLLGDVIESRMDHFGNSDLEYSILEPGINISLGLSYKF